MGIVATGSLGFTASGTAFSFGTAPTVNDYDVLGVNSDTTVSTPAGFTLLDSSVSNQGSYVFYRKAIGGESNSVTITLTTNGVPATLVWARINGATALDVNAKASNVGTSSASSPPATTAVLAGTGELALAFAFLHRYATITPSAPVWNNGYTNLQFVTQGSGLSGTVGILGSKSNVGTAAETVSCSWTDGAFDRDTFVMTFKLAAVVGTATSMDVQGELNRIAKTNGLSSQGAANVIAGTKGLGLAGALNVKAGNTLINYKDLQGVANQLAGTSGLGTAKALSLVAPIP